LPTAAILNLQVDVGHLVRKPDAQVNVFAFEGDRGKKRRSKALSEKEFIHAFIHYIF
jgi:hypothetical protein